MLISFENVSFAYRDVPILQDVSFALHENESVGFIGGNGEGKTTLLRLLLNELTPDEGNIFRKNNLKIGYLPQNGGLESEGTVFSAMSEVFEEDRRLISRLEQAQAAFSRADEKERISLASELESLQRRIDARDSYHVEVRIRTVACSAASTRATAITSKCASAPFSTVWALRRCTIRSSPRCRAGKRRA